MKKILLSRGFFPSLFTSLLLFWLGSRFVHGEWWWALFSLAVCYGPSMAIPYIVGCMTGIDNIYSRVTEAEQSQKDDIARLQADVSELKNYMYHRFG